jgi:hypothetical protein
METPQPTYKGYAVCGSCGARVFVIGGEIDPEFATGLAELAGHDLGAGPLAVANADDDFTCPACNTLCHFTDFGHAG